jgi:hypothetical protein
LWDGYRLVTAVELPVVDAVLTPCCGFRLVGGVLEHRSACE